MSLEFHGYEMKREPTMLPTPKEFCVENNPSYAKSLVTGIVSPLFHLPQIIFFGCLWPFITAIGKSIAYIGLSMYAGFTGRASGYRTTEVKSVAISQADRQKAVNRMLEGSGFVAVPIEAITEPTSEK
jgi:hypothetical protein